MRKIMSTSVLLALLCLTVFFFIRSNNGTNFKALADIQTSKKSSLNIPSDINFIDDDKKAFLEYCRQNKGASDKAQIDDTTYVYYGCLNGYRFYRLNLDCYPAEELNHEENIGGYVFQSSRSFYPYVSGLYIIGNDGVHTLSEACSENIVDIGKIFLLYQKTGK